MAVISLLTDFGLKDEYVGLMKGVILSVNPAAKIVDLSHEISPQDIVKAAYMLNASYKFFPPKTIHIAVVDPGVGSVRDILAVKADGYFFVAPDNGLLTHILRYASIESVYKVQNRSYFYHPTSSTFHGRDIMAPVAAHLSLGVSIQKFGIPADLNTLTLLGNMEPKTEPGGRLSGMVVSVDRFGNLITNIDYQHLISILEISVGQKLTIIVGNTRIDELSETYSDKPHAHPVALIGSRGFLEISINEGNASKTLQVKPGDKVMVESR